MFEKCQFKSLTSLTKLSEVVLTFDLLAERTSTECLVTSWLLLSHLGKLHIDKTMF